MVKENRSLIQSFFILLQTLHWKIQKFEELIKLEIINLESPLNKYTNFCQSEKYEDKTYFSFKINFPTILFMDKDKKEATITQIVFYLIDRLDRLIEKF